MELKSLAAKLGSISERREGRFVYVTSGEVELLKVVGGHFDANRAEIMEHTARLVGEWRAASLAAN